MAGERTAAVTVPCGTDQLFPPASREDDVGAQRELAQLLLESREAVKALGSDAPEYEQLLESVPPEFAKALLDYQWTLLLLERVPSIVARTLKLKPLIAV